MKVWGVYLLIGRWLGWLAWAVAVGASLWFNSLYPVLDETLVLLCGPIVLGLTVRPLVKFLWPLLIAGAGTAVFVPAHTLFALGLH